MNADVVVVGGGIVGAAIAYELVDAGADTVLVDAHHPGRATDAGAGILSPETTTDADDAWFDLAMAAGHHHRALVERLKEDGIAETGYSRCGLLSVAVRADEDGWFETALRLSRRRTPSVEEISVGEARSLFPPLARVHRARYNPSAAKLDGRVLTGALRAAAERRGGRVLEARVMGFASSGRRCARLDTDGGSVPCGTVVLAGGAWSSALGEALGFDLPIRPLKGQIVHLCLPGADTTGWPIVQPVMSFYQVPWPGGRLACGGTFEEVGFDVRPTVEGLRDLLRECLLVSPGLAGGTFEEVRVGLRPVAADGRPVLGQAPGWENVYVATGHGADGLLLGPYTASLIAHMALGRPVPDQLAPFDPGRFPAGRASG